MAQTIIVDISTRGANPVAYTHQGDTGRTFFAEIYENGEPFAVAGYTIKVAAILPADRGYTVIAGNDMVTATKTNDNTTNKIYFTLSENYSLKAGNGILTLIFTSNTGTPSTIRPINIDLRIQKSADAEDVIAGASDFPEGLEEIAESVFQEYLSTYLPPVAPSSSADANKAASAKLTGQELDNLKSDINDLQSDMSATFGENTITFDKFAFGDDYSNQMGKGLTECKKILTYQGSITAILHGWTIPVKEGQTLHLNGFEIITRNGSYGVEIWETGAFETTQQLGVVFRGTNRLQTFSASPNNDGTFPISSELDLTADSVAWITPKTGYAEVDDNYDVSQDTYEYPTTAEIWTTSGGEEEPESDFSKWYKDNQTDNFVIGSNYNKTFFWSLFQAVSGMVNANCLVLGDSLTEISAKDVNINSSQGNRPYYGYGWFTRIARKYNMTCDIYGRSSARWWTQESGGSTQHSCCTDVAAICADTSLDADNYQYIIIEYGTNDIWFGHDNFGTLADVASNAVHTTTVSAVRYCIESLQTKFTGAKIIVIMPTIIKDNLQEYQKNYYTIIDQVLDEYGIKRVYPRYEAGITLAMMRDDGVHLDKWENNTHINNVEAVKRFSECLEGGMLSI